jgi:prolycopene isomerase
MKEKYDVVIIGGGIAGLSTGLYLQKMGKRSLILEHGNQAGGNMSGIWRKGFYFDCGDMSTEEVGVLFPILKDLGLYDPDEWMQARWRWVTPDCDVMFYDYDQMREDFKKGFPNSAAGIDQWFDFVTPTCRAMRDMMKSGPFPFAVQGWEKFATSLRLMGKSLPLMSSAKAMMTMTGEEMVKDMFPDEPRLRWLFGEANVKNMLLMMHIFFWYAFVQDYWYPKAGLQGFINKLVKAYQERGGEIRFKSTVDKVITSGRMVTACETSKQERFEADYFVNTGNPKRLISEMLDSPSAWPHQDAQKILQAPVSKAVCSAFLGVDMSGEELKKHVKDHHTIYWRTYDSPDYDVYDPNAHNRGWSMISATSLHLPHLAPAGKSSMVVQVFNSYRWQNGWKTGTDDPFARNQEYRELKQKVLDDIIKKTEYIVPGLSDKIIYKELATPRSMSRWTLNPEGSIMGWTYDYLKCHMAKKHVRFRTPLKNLFQAGHYSIWPGGVVFSAMSGKIVSRGIYEGFWRQLII